MPRKKIKPVGEKRTSRTTEKKVKIIGQEQYIRAGTGEVEEFQVINIEDRDFNFHKLWLGHIINSLELIGNQKTKLAFWIIEQLDYENKLCMTQRQIAEKSGISLQTVARTMKALQECNFIQAINQGCYRVNPNVIFKGTRGNRLNVLYKYHENNENTTRND